MSEKSSDEDSEMLSDEDEAPPPTSFDIEAQLVSEKYDKTEFVRIFPSGEKMTYSYLAETGFEWPMLFRTPDGLGLKIPNKW
jgi:hypothetical protein